MNLYELGYVSGQIRRQTVCLRAKDEFELVVGNNVAALSELVNHQADGFRVDMAAVQRLVDRYYGRHSLY